MGKARFTRHYLDNCVFPNFRHFTKHAVGNVDLLYLVVSCVDGRQVQQLVCHVVAKDFHMFKKDSVQMALQASLNWETFEQYAFWQVRFSVL